MPVTAQEESGTLLTPLTQLISTLNPWPRRSSITARADSLPASGSTGAATAIGAATSHAAAPVASNVAATHLAVCDTSSIVLRSTQDEPLLCCQTAERYLGSFASILSAI
jgi:hypothetical protein